MVNTGGSDSSELKKGANGPEWVFVGSARDVFVYMCPAIIGSKNLHSALILPARHSLFQKF
jgi:hypothetical protein